MRATTLYLTVGAVFGFAGTCLAENLAATERFSGTAASFDFKGQYNNATLTVSGPNGFTASASAPSGAPSLDLSKHGSLEDGLYKYHIVAGTPKKAKVRAVLDNGREGRPASEQQVTATTSGTFRVKGGAIVANQAAPEPGKGRKDQ